MEKEDHEDQNEFLTPLQARVLEREQTFIVETLQAISEGAVPLD